MIRSAFLFSVIAILSISLFFQLEIYSPTFFSDIKNSNSKAKIRFDIKKKASDKFRMLINKEIKPNEKIKAQTNYTIGLIDLPKNNMMGHVIQKWTNGECKQYYTGSIYNQEQSDLLKRSCQITITEETVTNDSLNIETELLYFKGFMGFFPKGLTEIAGGKRYCIDLPSGGIYKSSEELSYINNHSILIPLLAYFIPKDKLEPENLNIDFAQLSMEKFIEQYVKPNKGFVIYHKVKNRKSFSDSGCIY